MLDRDKEIEALALRMLEDAMAAPDALWPIEASEARWRWSNARRSASLIIHARNEDRDIRKYAPAPESAEQTPPALPTDRMGLLELWLRCCHALELDGDVYLVNVGDASLLGSHFPSVPAVEDEVFNHLLKFAAELTAKDGGA